VRIISERASMLAAILTKEREKRVLRTTLVAHIAEQAQKYGPRCPATQATLRHNNSVLIKVHKPTPLWCVVDGHAYDCAVEDGTMDEIRRETVFRVEVIDGRTL